MDSNLLNTSVKYSVYLPDGYDDSKDKYPIVYLLNGFTGDETDWHMEGLLTDIVNLLIKAKKIEPMIIVMPDGDDRLYINKGDGTYPYEDMFITEFLPFIEAKYKVKDEKKYRGISGLSMGGNGSLRLTLKHHNLFGVCASFSSSLKTDEEIINDSQEHFDNYFGRISPEVKGEKGKVRLTDAIKEFNLFELIEKKDPKLLKTVDIYFDCGDDDFLTIGNSTMHIELTKKGIPHEYRVRDGGHTWNFWIDSLPIGLEFISESMHKDN
ncbi:endo-1,4-beta-xylanase A precursor [Winogradskyella sp. PG-2]|nr:endo-1,4-beta-xylanase A precursor [Winogradskyella sp. PG-2]